MSDEVFYKVRLALNHHALLNLYIKLIKDFHIISDKIIVKTGKITKLKKIWIMKCLFSNLTHYFDAMTIPLPFLSFPWTLGHTIGLLIILSP